MNLKTPKPPLTRRVFVNPWGELDYLCKKLRYWLYTRKSRGGADRYLPRLERVLRRLRDDSNEAIIRQEGLALLHELKGQVRGAIKHREREIQLMEKLHREARSPKYDDATRAYLLRERDGAVLQQRRSILEELKKVRARSSHIDVRAG